MSDDSPSGIVAVGEMHTVTLTMGILMVVIDGFAEIDLCLICVNKLMHVCAVNLKTVYNLWFCSFRKDKKIS